MNLVVEQGRPTLEPEIHQARASGRVFCKIRLAVEREYKGKDVPRKTDYFDVLCFGKLAQTVYNNVAKGALITVLGRLENTERQDRMGNKYQYNVIVANKVTIHEWLRKHRPLEELQNDFDTELLVPREITNSLYKQIDITDEDIPDDLAGRSIDDLL